MHHREILRKAQEYADKKKRSTDQKPDEVWAAHYCGYVDGFTYWHAELEHYKAVLIANNIKFVSNLPSSAEIEVKQASLEDLI